MPDPSKHCPACQSALWAPREIGAKDCPRCGAELWHIPLNSGTIFCLRQSGQSLEQFLSGLFNLEDRTAFESLDSMDYVELLMEVEERLDEK